MLYFESDSYQTFYSHRKQDWLEVEKHELLTDREISRYQGMGYNINYYEFTPIITSQKNVKITNGIRMVIDREKVQPY